MTLSTTDLADRVILLTGVTGDIGQAYLKSFTAAGAHVVAADIPALEDDGQRLAQEANQSGPGRAVFAGCDITDEVAVQRTVETAIKEFGGLHSVVNNAAIYRTLGASNRSPSCPRPNGISCCVST